MLLLWFSSNVTPRIFFVTATPRTLDFKTSATCLPAHPFDTLAGAYGTENAGGEQHGGAMVRKIAVEEHCLCPGFEDYWAPTVVDLPANRREEFHARLTDFGEMRLKAM